jgi:uncharacterized membrane protein
MKNTDKPIRLEDENTKIDYQKLYHFELKNSEMLKNNYNRLIDYINNTQKVNLHKI